MKAGFADQTRSFPLYALTKEEFKPSQWDSMHGLGIELVEAFAIQNNLTIKDKIVLSNEVDRFTVSVKCTNGGLIGVSFTKAITENIK